MEYAIITLVFWNVWLTYQNFALDNFYGSRLTRVVKVVEDLGASTIKLLTHVQRLDSKLDAKGLRILKGETHEHTTN